MHSLIQCLRFESHFLLYIQIESLFPVLQSYIQVDQKDLSTSQPTWLDQASVPCLPGESLLDATVRCSGDASGSCEALASWQHAWNVVDHLRANDI